MTIATPFMKPAITGYGTNRTSVPRRAMANAIWVAPASASVAPAMKTIAAARPAPEVDSVGSNTSDVTSAARISVLDVRTPAPGIGAPPAMAAARPPKITALKPARTPTSACAAPSAPKASRPSVRIGAS
jgi:hypothetical protein